MEDLEKKKLRDIHAKIREKLVELVVKTIPLWDLAEVYYTTKEEHKPIPEQLRAKLKKYDQIVMNKFIDWFEKELAS